jgi:hypothetical protein
MKMSLNNYKQDLLSGVLSLLWRQWSLLGIPGQLIEERRVSGERYIIDPEALLLVTSELARFDARLFDESLNWLRQYGKLINIQRLKGILQLHELGNRQVLAAMASTVLENRRLSKWRAIESLGEKREGNESLFKNSDGAPAPVFGKGDPHFAKFGLFRGQAPARADAMAPKVGSHPELLLVKLRALLGVNARAEIISALLSLQVAHPSALARRISYLPRSVQDTLNEMALSGHVTSERSREKYFSLRPGDWNFLMTWTAPDSQTVPRFPNWIDWTVVFALLQDTITLLNSGDLEKASTLMAALRLRDIYERHAPQLAETGLAENFINTSRRTGLEFLESFLAELKSF